jgi:hypothetical protein
VVWEDCGCVDEVGRGAEGLEGEKSWLRNHAEQKSFKVKVKSESPPCRTKRDKDWAPSLIEFFPENVLISELKLVVVQTAIPADTDIRGQHVFRTSDGTRPGRECQSDAVCRAAADLRSRGEGIWL